MLLRRSSYIDFIIWRLAGIEEYDPKNILGYHFIYLVRISKTCFEQLQQCPSENYEQIISLLGRNLQIDLSGYHTKSILRCHKIFFWKSYIIKYLEKKIYTNDGIERIDSRLSIYLARVVRVTTFLRFLTTKSLWKFWIFRKNFVMLSLRWTTKSLRQFSVLKRKTHSGLTIFLCQNFQYICWLRNAV